MSLPFAAPLRRGRNLIAPVALAALLAACGGSVSRVEPFQPEKLVVFGDELSLLISSTTGATAPVGYKYSINALTTNSSTGATTLDCASNPVWTQVVASSFGLQFAACGATSATATAQMNAGIDATVDQVVQQVGTYRAQGGTFNSKTLVTVQAGLHDIVSAYEAVKAGTLTDSAAVTQVEAKAVTLANLINDIANSDGRVLYLTVYSLRFAPYWTVQSSTDQTRTANIDHLTQRFNNTLRKTVNNNGYTTGLVLADSTINSMHDAPKPGINYSLDDVSAAACVSTVPPLCTTATIATDNTANPSRTVATSWNYLWADDRWPGPAAHGIIGANAVSRARNNPF